MDHKSRGRRHGKRWAGALVAVSMITLAACASDGSNGDGENTGATSGDGPGEGTPVEISFQWWGNDERAALTEAAIDIFEDQNPGVTVATTFSTIDAYIPKLATQIATSSAPDLFLIPMESVKEYTTRGATLNLSEYIGSVISIDDIPETTQQIGMVDGEFYGFTLGTAADAWIYNPEVWEEAGAKTPGPGFTWDDLIEAGELIREASDGQTAAISDPGGWIAWFSVWLRQNDRYLFTEDGELGFEENDLVEWYELMERLRESGATTDAQTTSTIDQSMQNSGLARGVAASEFAAASLTGAYVDTLGDGNVALAPFPTDTGVLGLQMAGTNVAAISSASDHPEVTARFLDFLINDRQASETLGLTRGIPINTANYEALLPTLEGGDRLVSEFVLGNEDSFIDPNPLAPPGVSTLPAEFTLAYEQIIFGQLSLEDSAAALYSTFQSAIS